MNVWSRIRFSGHPFDPRLSSKLAVGAVALGLLTLTACSEHSSPNYTYMPDMAYSPAFKAQKEGAMRLPVQGTIPQGFTPYPYAQAEGDLAGKELKNPLQPTRATFQRGQELFNIYCIVCHGRNAEGDGYIVPKFPRPPSLHSDKVRNWPDGRIFHVISTGQNLMPSYATQIAQEDRWAIIYYVRALQRAMKPTPEDLEIAKQRGDQGIGKE